MLPPLLPARLSPAAAFGQLRWPLPAVVAWGASWAVWAVCQAGAWPGPAAAWPATLAGAALAACCTGAWRRALAAAGFPLSAWALGGAAALPAWAWLLPLVILLVAYPLRAWRDAPFFPTPAGALDGLPGVVGTPRRVLDAGCGLGHGLRALGRLWPQAELQGVEWSPLLARAAAWRCRGSRVRRGDMWAASWAGLDLVYLFQRPESMARAFDKAARELGPSAWLVSLEFPVPGVAHWACLQGVGRRPVWIYRPAAARAAAGSSVSPPGR